ncbi:MAG: cadherin-like domain-containing protein [Bacteroidetes bacterium]|nr:cadherin-like domain-containing protein [Bacteroidota bacterium]
MHTLCFQKPRKKKGSSQPMHSVYLLRCLLIALLLFCSPKAHAQSNPTFAISGTVFNDVNGLSDNTINGIGLGSASGNLIYINLVKNGFVIASTIPSLNGIFSFASLDTGLYDIQISMMQGIVLTLPPASSLPSGWVYVGENLGSLPGNDGSINGYLSQIHISNANISEVNFGIEELPTPLNYIAIPQVNPGGLMAAPVSPSFFFVNDPNGGFITAIRILNFPFGAAGISINGIYYNSANFPLGGVLLPTNANGQPLQSIGLDPFNGNVSHTIYYSAIDNAGKESINNGQVQLSYYTISLQGTVFNDVNGLTDNYINGVGVGNPSGMNLYINILNSFGNVIGSTPVNANGTYTIATIDPGNYSLQLNVTQGIFGYPPPILSLPLGWVPTGEKFGNGSGHDGVANGLLQNVIVTDTNVFSVNFGIEELPTPINYTAASQVNPGSTNFVSVNPSYFHASDPSGGSISSIRIISFPSQASHLTINGITYTASSFPSIGIDIPSNALGEPLQSILMNPFDGNITAHLLFKAIDNAGKLSNTSATIQLPFNTLQISGKVYNDVNGLTDFTVNGMPFGNPASTTLYANLINSSNAVIANTIVSLNGDFLFDLLYPGTYSIQVSTQQGLIGNVPPLTLLPSNWVYTGEFQGVGMGNDFNANGLLSGINLSSNGIHDLSFGIESLANCSTTPATQQINPGGSNLAVVPANSFSANDFDGGYIVSITINAFPSNANAISINGTWYTSLNFPISGITIPSNSVGEPLQNIEIDPIDGNALVSISFLAIDNAGFVNNNAGFASVQFNTLSISGSVLNDANGMSDTLVNGFVISNPLAASLYLNLLNTSGYVIQSNVVLPNGTYHFTQLYPGNYIVQLSLHPGTIGQIAPSAELPSGYTYTGEHIGLSMGNDGTVDGLLNVSLNMNDAIEANFAIEELPIPYILSALPQINPGSNISIVVPPNLFGAYEFNGGFATEITLSAFPINTHSLMVDGILYLSSTFPLSGITIPLDALGLPVFSVSIDPLDGALNVIIPFSAKDNAGKISPATGLATLPFYSAGINGFVLNDVNGLSDSIVNGYGIGHTNGNPLFVNLLDTLGFVIDTSVVQSNGSYHFTQVNPGNYSLQLSITMGTIGSLAPISTLPSSWVHTGEFIGTGIGNDGLPNNILAGVQIISNDINHANFGIEELPFPLNSSNVVGLNPGANNCALVPSTAFNADDSSGGFINTIALLQFPSNVNSITVNGNLYTTSNFPVVGIYLPTLANGELAVPLCVDPINGAQTISIEYYAIDNANQMSLSSAQADFIFTSASISGNVYNDINGLVDATVNGAGIASPSSSALYANLLDTNSIVVANTTINANGMYTFQGLDAGHYAIQLSTLQGIVGTSSPQSILPANWAYTGENIGNASGSDGYIDGKLANVFLVNADLMDANFGIEELAIPLDANANVQPNIGSTVESWVNAILFSANDASGGQVTDIHLPIFPEKATSITINNINYLPSTFPVAGVTIPANTYGQPLQSISVDPIDGAIAVIIHYQAIDNANLKSEVIGKIRLPYSMPHPDINVAFTNLLIEGNVSTNDKVPAGTSYSNPFPNPANPSSSLPIVTSTGSYTFTTSVSGVYIFKVPVLSPGGGNLLIDLIINVLNDGTLANPPVANLDIAYSLSSMPVVIQTLANDGCGNLSCNVLPSSVTIISSPGNGSATVNPSNGRILYVPNPNFLGADTLVYQVCDNTIPSQCATSRQIIFVLPSAGVNTTSACDDYKMTHVNTPAYGNLLINDIDPEHQIQTAGLQNITIPGKGSLGVYSNGNYTFLPVTNFTGHVDFPYTVCDAGTTQACVQATLHILVSSNVALPVEMDYFIAEVKDCKTHLLWGTKTEMNSLRFSVFRKGKGDFKFTKIGSVAAAGNSNERQHYSYTDENVLDGSYEYFIESEDIDGKLQQSKMQTADIQCDQNLQIVVFPNPAHEYININIVSNSSELFTIGITDLTGRQLAYSQTFSENGTKTIQIPTSHFSNGNYHIKIESENYRKVFLVNITN